MEFSRLVVSVKVWALLASLPRRLPRCGVSHGVVVSHLKRFSSVHLYLELKQILNEQSVSCTLVPCSSCRNQKTFITPLITSPFLSPDPSPLAGILRQRSPWPMTDVIGSSRRRRYPALAPQTTGAGATAETCQEPGPLLAWGPAVAAPGAGK
jgi:hypothetical protein